VKIMVMPSPSSCETRDHVCMSDQRLAGQRR